MRLHGTKNKGQSGFLTNTPNHLHGCLVTPLPREWMVLSSQLSTAKLACPLLEKEWPCMPQPKYQPCPCPLRLVRLLWSKLGLLTMLWLFMVFKFLANWEEMLHKIPKGCSKLRICNYGLSECLSPDPNPQEKQTNIMEWVWSLSLPPRHTRS